MQNRLVQTSSRTKIGADLISNRTKIGTNATNCTRLTKIGAIPNRTKISANPVLRHTKIGVIPILQLTKIGVVPNRTEIGADPILRHTEIGIVPIPQLTKISAVLDCTKISANPIYSNNITRIPHAKANRIGRVPIRRVFNDKVIQLAIAIKAIQIKPNQLTSLRAPTAPFKAVNLNQAFTQDATNWVLSILNKLKSLKKINTFKIIKGRILANNSSIIAR